MQYKRVLLRMTVAAVVVAANTLAVVPVGAAAAGVAAASSTSAQSADWSKLSGELRRTTKPGPVKLVMPSGIGIMATQIVCYVYASGPAGSNGGRNVRFSIDIFCTGGTPADLSVTEMDMWRYAPGGPGAQVPGSFRECSEPYTTILSCVSEVPCFQAGAVYDGLARLFAIDDVGGTHTASVYAPPRAVSCLV